MTKSKRSKAKNTRRRRTSNPTRVVVVAPRSNRRRKSSNPRRRYATATRNRRRTYKRNPTLFGSSMGSKATLETIGGVLLGVAATKMAVGWMPANLVGIGGSWGKVIASGAVAFGLGMLAKKMSNGSFGDGVLLGGLAQTGSVGINALSPTLGAQFGLGDLIPGRFTVPENPVLLGRPAAAAAPRISPAGIGRAYGNAY